MTPPSSEEPLPRPWPWPWPDLRWQFHYGDPWPCSDQPHRDFCEWCSDRSHWAPDRVTTPDPYGGGPVPLHRNFISGVQVVAVAGPRTVRVIKDGKERDCRNVVGALRVSSNREIGHAADTSSNGSCPEPST
jgi:hypothetical protein